MIIKNISKKLICVDGKNAMPNDEITVSDAVAQTPAVNTLVRLGLLTVHTAKKTVEQPKATPRAAKQPENTQKTEQQTAPAK